MRPDYAWPKARIKDLVVQELNRETMVYDKKSQQAHCLNELAGLVWRHCDGQRGWQDLAALAQEKLGVPNDSQVIEFVVNELVQVKLLQGNLVVTPEQTRFTRREVARRFGSASPMLLTPLVTTTSTAAASVPAIIPFSPPAKAA